MSRIYFRRIVTFTLLSSSLAIATINIVILVKPAHIREVNFVAGFIKDFDEDVIYSACFENPAVSWMNFKT